MVDNTASASEPTGSGAGQGGDEVDAGVATTCDSKEVVVVVTGESSEAR